MIDGGAKSGIKVESAASRSLREGRLTC